jgi:hypothetical protein
MQGQREAGKDPGLCDEIARLARKYLEDPRSGGVHEIDRIIDTAKGDSRWDDVSKWHRVRLRLQRYQQERQAAARLISGGTLS